MALETLYSILRHFCVYEFLVVDEKITIVGQYGVDSRPVS